MTAKIKLNAASGGGSFSLQAPSSSANNRVFTLPDVADATMATVNGISEFDTYHLSISISADVDPIASNIVRSAFTGSATQIGTGMTQNSGIWTFPSTGKYLVFVNAQFNLNGSDSISLDTYVTTNNGTSYSAAARAIDGCNGTGTRQGNGTSLAFLDVTDTSQVKVKFAVGSIGTSSGVSGNSNFRTTTFTFIKIGET